MRIEKWGFLLSYIIYLIFCTVFSVSGANKDAINSMIFSITIASAAFALSDLFFTIININKRERKLLFDLYYITHNLRNVYIKKLETKYGGQAKQRIDMLETLFENDDDMVNNFLFQKLTKKENELFLEKIQNSSLDSEFLEFVKNYNQTPVSDGIKEISNRNQETKDIDEILRVQKKKERVYYIIATSFAVAGLISLLVILTIRYQPADYINNVITVLAFMCVILNLFVKDYYKAESIKELENEKKKLLEEWRETNK